MDGNGASCFKMSWKLPTTGFELPTSDFEIIPLLSAKAEAILISLGRASDSFERKKEIIDFFVARRQRTSAQQDWTTLDDVGPFILEPIKPPSVAHVIKTLTIVTQYLFKKCHSRPLFRYFRLFNTVDSKCSIWNVANDWIRIANLLNWKQPLY